MRRQRLLVLLFLAIVCLAPTLAQSITLTKEFQIMPNVKALDVYRNQFGKFERVGAEEPFPYAVIRVGLDGTPEDIKAAKQRLSFQLGRVTSVETVFKDARNELLFLVPTRARNIQMSCDGECLPQMMFDSLVVLQPNTVFYGRVHFSLDETRDPDKLAKYVYTLTVEPADAKVELRNGFVNEEWVLKDGMTEQLLTEGTYYYTITAEDYRTAEGSLVVDSLHRDTTIALVPKFGLLSVRTDSADLAGLSVEVEYMKQKQQVELPYENKKCGLGQYTLTIKKPKYHTWKKKVVVPPVVALRRITSLFVRMLICLANASLSAMRSLCVSATIAGISLTLSSSKSLSSVSVPASVKSTTAISVLSSIRAVRAIRSLPNDVMSSRPGVSMIRAADRKSVV